MAREADGRNTRALHYHPETIIIMTNTRRTFILAHAIARRLAAECCMSAPDGYMVMVQEPTRSLEQNAKFHALCSDIAQSGMEWAGKKRTSSQWKVLLVSAHAVATNDGAEIVPGIENEFVNLRESTALMSKKRGASLIEYTLAFCACHDIKLSAE